VGAARSLAALIGALTLTACAAPAPLAPAPVLATPDPGLAARGTSGLVVRAQVPGAFGPVEQAGIPCTLVARGFRAAFVTPARVEVPNLGARQPQATLTCTGDGQPRSLTLAPANLTASAEFDRSRQGLPPGGGAFGLGLVTVAIVSGLRRDQPGDVWGYRDATVVFE
jgi:hypothetical protein